MIDEDEIEDKEISEEIAELMKGQGIGEADAGAAVDILDEERAIEEHDDEGEEKSETANGDDADVA
jgi:hypothetical protein